MDCYGPVNHIDVESQKLCCFNLRRSILVIGVAGAICGFSVFLRVIFFDFDDPILQKPLIHPDFQLMVKTFFCLLSLGNILLSLLLTVGVMQEKAFYLFAYLGHNVAGMVLLVVLILTSFFAPFPVIFRILIALIFASIFALNYYILRKIYGYYLHLRYLELEKS